MGRHLGFSWIAKLILDFRCPKRVPVICFPPLCIPVVPSWWWNLRPGWSDGIADVGILHGVVMIGNDFRTDFTRRSSFFFLLP